jgi:4'-phosphopantetheinyl transferase
VSRTPAVVRLDAGRVDVWRADLDGAGEGVVELLSAEERERAGRFVREEDGRRWARARGVLRVLLGRYLGADPGGLRFVVGEHGKPALEGGDGELRFNVSHSSGVALYAFARGREVGVDVELPRRAIDAVALAERTFGEAEAERLRMLDPPAREREFLRLWARHEAQLKCRGTGIGGADESRAPGEAGVAPHGRAASDLASSASLWVVELDAGAEGGAAALAVEGSACELRRWEWRD